jgi:hypothetical protein
MVDDKKPQFEWHPEKAKKNLKNMALVLKKRVQYLMTHYT